MIRVERLDASELEPYRHVGDHRWLRAHDLFVAEGRFVVERLIAARSYAIHSVLVSPAAYTALADVLRVVNAPVYVAPQPLFNDVAGFNFHRGCLALAVRPAPREIDAVARARVLLGLEAIGNPDNVGGLFRTAAAFGVDALLLDGRTGDPFYRKALRTSMGAVLRLPFVRITSWPEAIARFREQGVRVIALTPEQTATPLDDSATSLATGSRLLVIVGTEGAGLSAEVRAMADARVRIPMAGGVDSLNVVVAAGVALSRVIR